MQTHRLWRQPRRAMGGFTLLELMIVVAIAAVLLAIAIPSYTGYVQRSRRSLAQGCLTERAQALERFYSANRTYVGGAPAQGCVGQLGDFYTFGFSQAATLTAYELSATPVDTSAQGDDECGVLTLHSNGTKGAEGPADCWR